MTTHERWKVLWERRRQLISCALLFQIAESILFAPLLGLVGSALLGQAVVDSTGLVSFVLSPRGFLLLFMGAATALTVRLLEQAGLSVIVLGAFQGKTIRALVALRLVLMQLPRLASVAAIAIGLVVLVAAPMLAVAAFFAGRLLPKHDINFYLATWPQEFITAATVIGLVAAATLAVGVWLFVRWRLVVQVCMFEGQALRRGRAVFREAAGLSRGFWWPLAGRCLAVLSLQVLLALTAAGLARTAAWLVLGVGNMSMLSLALSFGFLVLLQTAMSAAVISIGACVDAAVFTAFYQKRRENVSVESTLARVETATRESAASEKLARGWAVAIVVGFCASEAFALFVMMDTVKRERPVTVTAHRGGHLKAPENTLAAIREAIAAGAQYAEIDVQISKDGVLVVMHDSDFSRMAGVAKKVWDLTYEEIHAIPLGANSASEFRDEPAPTFDQALALSRDRIKLNIELKYYGDHQPRLAERVLEEVRARDMARQVIVQCLEYEPLQEVRRLAPEIPVGYLLSVNARNPERLEVDFLGAAANRATGAFVRAAHRRGQQVHVWTVDKPETMARMIDLGVDSLITNQPEEALRLVREYESLSPAERALRGVRAWLAD